MTYRRLDSTTSATTCIVTGMLTAFSADQINGTSIAQGDAKIEIGSAELAAASITPRARDEIIIDGRYWSISGATPIYD